MQLTLMKSKLHGATVTAADLHYEGSIAIDPELVRCANLREFERVDIYNCHNGARFSTYVILGAKRGEMMLNGAAARMVQPGDRIIVVAYAEFSEAEARRHRPTVVLLDAENRPKLKRPARRPVRTKVR